jgi:hypothetical protein
MGFQPETSIEEGIRRFRSLVQGFLPRRVSDSKQSQQSTVDQVDDIANGRASKIPFRGLESAEELPALRHEQDPTTRRTEAAGEREDVRSRQAGFYNVQTGH